MKGKEKKAWFCDMRWDNRREPGKCWTVLKETGARRLPHVV